MTKPEIDADGLRYPMAKRSAYWTFDEKSAETVGNLYYFAPLDRVPPPYLTQRRVEAIIDIAADGTLAGVELIDNMPPPPRSATSPSEHEAMSSLNDKAEMAQQLREWVHLRYGKWITRGTAESAITYITECDKDGNKRKNSP